jgi:hypothetical protein
MLIESDQGDGSEGRRLEQIATAWLSIYFDLHGKGSLGLARNIEG